jgi:hypothetical protein
MDELLDAIRKLTEAVDRLTDAAPKVSYRVPAAALQTGVDISVLYKMVRAGEVAKVPHMGTSVLIPHGELVRRFGTVARDGLAVAS